MITFDGLCAIRACVLYLEGIYPSLLPLVGFGEFTEKESRVRVYACSWTRLFSAYFAGDLNS